MSIKAATRAPSQNVSDVSLVSGIVIVESLHGEQGESAFLAVLTFHSPFSRDYNPEDHVGHEARQATREQQDQEKQAEPPRADAEKSAQAAANAPYHSVLSPQFVIVCHRLVSSTRVMVFS